MLLHLAKRTIYITQAREDTLKSTADKQTFVKLELQTSPYNSLIRTPNHGNELKINITDYILFFEKTGILDCAKHISQGSLKPGIPSKYISQ
jgi:hypothetical protein